MNDYKRPWYMHPLLRMAASLKLTVWLLTLLMLLVFFSTLAQRFMGIWEVMDNFYKSPIAYVELRYFLPWQPIPSDAEGFAGLYRTILQGKGGFYFPGGVTLAIPLLINLLAAHISRYGIIRGHRLAGWLLVTSGTGLILLVHLQPHVRGFVTATLPGMVILGLLQYVPVSIGCAYLFGRKAGIVMIHASIVMLIAGEGIARYGAVEMHMTIFEGGRESSLYDLRSSELVIGLPLNAEDDAERTVIRIPEAVLIRASQREEAITLPNSDVTVHVDTWYPHATLAEAHPADTVSPIPTPVGDRSIRPLTRSPSDNASMHDAPAAIIRLRQGDWISEPMAVASSVAFMPEYTGWAHPLGYGMDTPEGTFSVLLRPIMHTLDFEVQLEDVTSSYYPGSTIPRHYSSSLTLLEDGHTQSASISMNKPLRHAGLTFFQSGAPTARMRMPDATVLQVVRNPGWTIPYIACGLSGVGLCLQFMLSLYRFTSRHQRGGAA